MPLRVCSNRVIRAAVAACITLTLGAAGGAAPMASAATPAAPVPPAATVRAPFSGIPGDEIALPPELLGGLEAPADGLRSADVTSTLVPHTDDTTDTTPSHYYTNAVPTRDVTWPRDRYGIIMTAYSFQPRPVYNPIQVALQSLGCYEYYLHYGDQSWLDQSLLHARWLRDKGMDSSGRFTYTWNYPGRGLHAPWYSSMAQGVGASALIRAYIATGDVSFKNAAVKAIRPFTRSISSGGVVYDTGSELWLEEYPENPPSHVLNGSMFAMFGIWDVVRVTRDATARKVFARATSTLASHLGVYERSGAVLYQTKGVNWAFSYHGLHIRQLRALGLVTGDVRFSNRATRWETQFRSYPLPRVGTGVRTVTVAAGGHVHISGTVSPLYRPCTVVVTCADSTASPRPVAKLTVGLVAGRQYGRFSFTTPKLTKNTSYYIQVSGEPLSAWRVSTRVVPVIAIGTYAGSDASGTIVTLVAATAVSQPASATVVWERSSGTKWATIGTAVFADTTRTSFVWRPATGRYTVRARFLGSVVNAPGVSVARTVNVQ